MDAIAAELGFDRAEVRERNFIQPEEMPYDHGLIFQDGRPLIYDSGDYPATLRKLKKLVGWDEFGVYREQARAEGRRVGIGIACYVEGTGVGPYEGGWVKVETDGSVVVATGLTTQGQGHQTAFAQVAADVLGVPLDRVTVVTGDTRRFGYAVGTFASRALVMSGNAIAAAARRYATRRCGSRATPSKPTPATWRSSMASSRCAGADVGDPAFHGRRAVQPAAVRLRRRVGTGDPVRAARRSGQTAGSRGRAARLGGHRLLLTASGDIRERHARGGRRDRPGHRRDQDRATAWSTTAEHWSIRGSSRDRSTAAWPRASVARSTSEWSTTTTGSCSTRRSWTS